MPLEYHELYKKESHGSYGSYGLKLEIAGKIGDLRKLGSSAAVYKAMEELENELLKEIYAARPETAEEGHNNRKFLLGCFPPAPIYVEEIPNGYCSRGCCAHLPWFIVTTSIGRIRIGWRKRVILIDWSETKDTKTSDELFAKEDVTKDTRMIHAWSYDKATEYLKAIIASPMP
jgi:hypothetical protein